MKAALNWIAKIIRILFCVLTPLLSIALLAYALSPNILMAYTQNSVEGGGDISGSVDMLFSFSSPLFSFDGFMIHGEQTFSATASGGDIVIVEGPSTFTYQAGAFVLSVLPLIGMALLFVGLFVLLACPKGRIINIVGFVIALGSGILLFMSPSFQNDFLFRLALSDNGEEQVIASFSLPIKGMVVALPLLAFGLLDAFTAFITTGKAKAE